MLKILDFVDKIKIKMKIDEVQILEDESSIFAGCVKM